MAKTGFWLRGAKGKVAGTTIYTSNGESVMRVINSSIKNPRTKAQMVQRVISKTVMNQYSALKAIADHSFEGKTAGAKSMAYFASINNKATRAMVAELQASGISLDAIYNFMPCKSNKFIPATCIVSEGSLPQIYTEVAADGSKGEVTLNAEVDTYESIINGLGLQRGDQLTFITIEKNSAGVYNAHYARIILDPRNTDGTAAPLTSLFVDGGIIVKPNFRNEGNFATILFEGDLWFNIGGGTVVSAGIIASRQVNNEWLRSNCQLTPDTNLLGDDCLSLEEAVALSTSSTPIYTNSSRYLNNAGVGGTMQNNPPVIYSVNQEDVIQREGYVLADLPGAYSNLSILGDYLEGEWTADVQGATVVVGETGHDIRMTWPENVTNSSNKIYRNGEHVLTVTFME